MKTPINCSLEIIQVQEFQNGNNAALLPILDRTKNGVQYCIASLIQDKYLCEDIFQETYLKAVKKIRAGKYKNEGRIQLWLNRIAYNLCYDELRKQKKFPKITIDNIPILDTMCFEPESIDEKVDRAFREKKIALLLNLLKPELRETVILRHFVGLSFKEISALQGVNVNTCLGRMRYALIYLREMTEKQSILI